MAPLDPVTWLPEAGGRPMRLQFASDDQYVPEAVAAEIAAAAGEQRRSDDLRDGPSAQRRRRAPTAPPG